MKETIEFRINYDYAHLLFEDKEGKTIGTSVKVIDISTDDPRYYQIPIIQTLVKKRYNKVFCFSWKYKRHYSSKELTEAKLFHLKIKTVFEPTGEECGTLYDEITACEICGANRKQIGPLILKKGTIPKRDIAKTIGGEIVVSEKFVNAIVKRNLKGLKISSTNIEKYYQLTANTEIKLSSKTVTGDNPFEVSKGSDGGIYNISGFEILFEKEVYVCPNGDTIGLNLLSEPYIFNNQSITNFDFFESEQKIGVKRGLLRPESIYLCSSALRKMIIEEKLNGFEFEISHIEGNE